MARKKNYTNSGYMPVDPKRSSKSFKKGSQQFGSSPVNPAYGSTGASAYSAANYVSGKRKKPMSTKKKVLIGVLCALLLCLVAAGVAFAVWFANVNSNIGFEDDTQAAEIKQALLDTKVDEEETVKEEYDPFYMLLMGSDARSDDTTSRSDVCMLARIDIENAQITLISIPRDTVVYVNGSMMKINAAYTYGASQTISTVSEFAGVTISHYAEIHFEELEDLVDLLGGVKVTVPEDMYLKSLDYEPLYAGEQTLDGEHALAFARERYNTSGGDFSRAQAQRLVAMAIVKQILAESPTDMPGTIADAAKCISTDLDLTTIVSMATALQGSDKELTFYSCSCPSYSFSQDGVSYVGTALNTWKAMMQRVDAGLDPNDETLTIPDEQLNNERLGAATNSASPENSDDLFASAGFSTKSVVEISEEDTASGSNVNRESTSDSDDGYYEEEYYDDGYYEDSGY